MIYAQILGLIDILWGMGFVIGAVLLSIQWRFKWISAGVLAAFLLFKMGICLGYSSWALLTEQNFDSGKYYYNGLPYADSFEALVRGNPSDYLTANPLIVREDTSSTDRLNSVTGLLLAVTGRSFMACALTLCCLGAAGQLLIFKYLRLRFPQVHPHYFYLLLFHPSSALWSSLLLKDTLGIFALGLLVYNLDQLLVTRKLFKTALVLLGAFIALNFRPFILVMILIFLLFALWDRVFAAKVRPQNRRFVTFTYVSFATLISVGALFYYVQNFGSDLADLQQSTSSYYTQIEAGSSFTQVNLNFTSLSGLMALPLGVINSLFRPFIWDINKGSQALAALENVAVLIFVFVGWRTYWTELGPTSRRYVRSIMYGSLIMTLICAAGVGVFSSNSGTISRYRIPLIPFFILGPATALGLQDSDIRRRRREAQEFSRLPRIPVQDFPQQAI